MSALLIYKALHIFFLIAWFAGIFYLPRLFVYHAETNSEDVSELFKAMERRLIYFVSPFALFTLIFGVLMIMEYGMAWFKMSYWLHAKLVLVILLYAHFGYCYTIVKQFKRDQNTRSPRFYRIFNEIPVILLIGIIFLAVLKPAIGS
ncbi:CopD family protein [Flocculibacter collagenilyticus]|uniref:CopD family protein n=1 Tax=Flocculibacter collagenilyticus TaxID=2744479 RepID=UPI0018F2DBF0|nr:CopD family protein [Flocculibacter collagenilyticus]